MLCAHSSYRSPSSFFAGSRPSQLNFELAVDGFLTTLRLRLGHTHTCRLIDHRLGIFRGDDNRSYNFFFAVFTADNRRLDCIPVVSEYPIDNMCRWITLISSDDMTLADLVLTASNSLVKMSYNAGYHPGFGPTNNSLFNGGKSL
jgi:hypothetical protein